MIIRRSKVPEIMLTLLERSEHVRGLQERVGGSASTIQQRIRELEAEGLVRQDKLETWPYRKILRLTEKGEEMAKIIKLQGGFLTAARKIAQENGSLRGRKKWIMAMMHAVGGEVKGSIRMQKLFFLLSQKRGIQKPGYDFSPFFFGPFSEEISGDTEELVVAGFVERQPEVFHPSRRDEDSIVRMNYRLTSDGEEQARKAFDGLSTKEKEALISLRRFNEMELGALLGHVYGKYPQQSKM